MKRALIIGLTLVLVTIAGAGGYYFWIQSGMNVADRVRPQTPIEPLTYPVEEVAITSGVDGITLAGSLSLPQQEGPRPAILLLGVAGPNDRDLSFAGHRAFAVIADRLARAGVAVLRMDDRGVGDSGGDWKAASYNTLAADALSALRYLASRPDIDPARIGVFGLSEGSLIAALTATVAESPVSFVVLSSPPGLNGEAALVDQFDRMLAMSRVTGARATRFREHFNTFIGLTRAAARDSTQMEPLRAFLAGPGRQLVPPYGFVPRDPMQQAHLFAGPWYQSQLDVRPSEIYAQLNAPMLVIGGGVDQVLPPATHHPVIRAAAPSAEFLMFDGVSHLLQPAETGLPSEYAHTDTTVDPRILNAIERWVIARVAVTPATPVGAADASADTE